MAADTLPRRLAAILYADVAGYSRLTSQDEDATHRVLREYLDFIARCVESREGRVMHYAGDAALAMFGAVVNAVDCALEIQADLARRNAERPAAQQIKFRVGVNLGDVIEDRGDIYGDGVNVAARLEALAPPGGICVSDAVRTAMGARLALRYVFLGEQRVKNIDEPVRAYHVVAPGIVHAPMDAAPQLPQAPSIAVLAFQNMSNDAEQTYFSDGVAEDIITELSRIPGMFVVARNSSFAYRGREVDLKAVGRELGVHTVLEGSVRKVGTRVRITAQLIDVATGGHLWAERYDRDLTDIFAVQDEVTREIVAALELKLSPEERQRIHAQATANLEAYECFLKGRDLDNLDVPEANAAARGMLEEAVRLDPAFAVAYAYLARNHLVARVNRWGEQPEASLGEALALAERAVALDEESAHAQYGLAIAACWGRQHERALAAARKSIALDPNFARGYQALGMALLHAGQPREAIAALERATRLDPLHRDVVLYLGAQAHFYLEEDDEAVALLRRRLIRKPESDISRVLLASAYGHLGDAANARDQWQRALDSNPQFSLAHRREVLPFKDSRYMDRLEQGLRKAGITA